VESPPTAELCGFLVEPDFYLPACAYIQDILEPLPVFKHLNLSYNKYSGSL